MHVLWFSTSYLLEIIWATSLVSIVETDAGCRLHLLATAKLRQLVAVTSTPAESICDKCCTEPHYCTEPKHDPSRFHDHLDWACAVLHSRYEALKHNTNFFGWCMDSIPGGRCCQLQSCTYYFSLLDATKMLCTLLKASLTMTCSQEKNPKKHHHQWTM